MGFLEGFFGNNSERENTDSAGHIANPERRGELAGEDQDNIDMARQLHHLEEQLARAQEDANAGRDPEIPIPELIEKIGNIRAQMPYGEENK